ncbi:MAG: tetratricopeptide repeat protein [Candidatus Marinimicrobia bacterium]|nr:tetratricopeptide repeat protein [Candidatus Neomarinimicrobiota bacterium]
MADPFAPLTAFMQELRRRRVFRVAAFYGGIAFVIVQIIDGTFEVMGVPAWVSRLLIVLLAAGFPVAMGLAWVFDVTPEGIVRTERPMTDPGSKGSAQPGSGKPLTSNRALIAIAILAVAFGIWGRWGGGGAVGVIRSIAVLPLSNLMNDPSQDYFVDGMHEALIAELSKISALRVIGRTSTMSYKANPKPIPEIAAELNVDAVIEGSVLRDGDRVRITVQLVATRPERHLWSDSYDRDLRDILILHSDVAVAIARQIELTIAPEHASRPTASPATVNSEAYNYVLLGNSYADRDFSRENFEIALDMFTRAAALDSTYALAYAGQAEIHENMYWFHYDHSPERILLAREALSKAERLAPDDPNVLFVKGMYLYHCYLDYEGALHEFDKIRAVWPNHPELDFGYAAVLRRQGKMEESVEHWRRAAILDPLNASMVAELGETYALQRAYPEAMASLNKALSLAPDRNFSYWQAIQVLYRWDGSTARAREMLAAAQAQTSLKGDPRLMHSGVLLKMFDGHFDQALDLLRSIPDEVISTQYFIVPKSLLAGQIYRLMGDTALATAKFESARSWLAENLAASYDDARFHSALGLAWAGLGERDKALAAGRRGVAELPVSKEAWRGHYRLIDLAVIQTMTGDYQDALENVDRLLALPGDLSLNEILLDPRWAALTHQPGFSRIEEKYGGGR